jgi:TPR repeat protein
MSARLLPRLPVSRADLDAISLQDWQAVLRGEPETALTWVRAAAALGHAEAQTVMGQWLLDGHGVLRDPTQALHSFLLAAHQGHAMGMNMAGRCHEQGWGTEVDFGKAAHWYRQAAKLALPQARYNLANLLASGQGVQRDHAQAFALYQQAADQGYAKAFAKLGRYHEDGLVVPQDAALATRCYRRGAEGGDFRGQFCYAGMLASGGQRDEAMRWLVKVMDTATNAYLREAGELLLSSTHADLQQIGRRMLDKGVRRSALKTSRLKT